MDMLYFHLCVCLLQHIINVHVVTWGTQSDPAPARLTRLQHMKSAFQDHYLIVSISMLNLPRFQ